MAITTRKKRYDSPTQRRHAKSPQRHISTTHAQDVYTACIFYAFVVVLTVYTIVTVGGPDGLGVFVSGMSTPPPGGWLSKTIGKYMF